MFQSDPSARGGPSCSTGNSPKHSTTLHSFSEVRSWLAGAFLHLPLHRTAPEQRSAGWEGSGRGEGPLRAQPRRGVTIYAVLPLAGRVMDGAGRAQRARTCTSSTATSSGGCWRTTSWRLCAPRTTRSSSSSTSGACAVPPLNTRLSKVNTRLCRVNTRLSNRSTAPPPLHRRRSRKGAPANAGDAPRPTRLARRSSV